MWGQTGTGKYQKNDLKTNKIQVEKCRKSLKQKKVEYCKKGVPCSCPIRRPAAHPDLDWSICHKRGYQPGESAAHRLPIDRLTLSAHSNPCFLYG